MGRTSTTAPAWTPETAPRNGGRPVGARDKINTRIVEATEAFLHGRGFDLTQWLVDLSTSTEPADRATLERFLSRFLPKDVNLTADVTWRAILDDVAERARARQAALDGAPS